MIIKCVHITDGPQLTPCDYAFALDAIKHKKARIYIDIQDAETDELVEKLDDVGIHGLIKNFTLEARHHPGFYPMKPLALMVMPVQMEVQAPRIIEYLTVIFCTDFLVTIRSSNMARFKKSLSNEESAELLPDDSIAGILSLLMLGLSLDGLRKASDLNDQILHLEEQTQLKPDSVNIDILSSKRSELLTLESIVQGQVPIIESVSLSHKALIKSERAEEYLIWAGANLKSASRKLDWLEHRLEVMHSLIQMHAQERTNNRLGRLTVITMIFMPITFLAGIWGMNFEYMPLLSYRFGIWVALAIMLAITGSMYLYYRRKGWFN